MSLMSNQFYLLQIQQDFSLLKMKNLDTGNSQYELYLSS